MSLQVRAERVGTVLLERVLELRMDEATEAEERLAAKTQSGQTLIAWPLSATQMIDFWMSNPWLAAIGNVLADAISGAKPELRARTVDLEGKLIDKSKLTRDEQDEDYGSAQAWLLRETFAYEGVSELSLSGFLRSCAVKYDQTGNVFCEVLRNKGNTEFTGLGVLLPQYVSYLGKKREGKPYVLQQIDPFLGEEVFVPFGERVKDEKAHEFLHQRATNSLSSFYGLPAWTEARDSVAVDNAHRRYLKDFFGNNATPRWMITITQDPAWQGETPDDGVLDQLYSSVRDYLTLNAGENAGRNLVLQYPGGIIVRAEPLDRDLQDPTFQAIASNMRDEILATRHVSLIDLGLPENSNRATGSVQSENFRRQVLQPFAQPIITLINRVLHAPPPHGLGVQSYDFALQFENVTDTLQRIEGIIRATGGAAVLSPDEGRAIIGYEEGRDSALYVPVGLIPGGVEYGNGPDSE